MEQQGLARRLVENATFAAEFPFIAIMPCAECTADGTMVPFGNVLYPDGRPGFGQVGFTPRMLLRIDQLVGAALERFGGDPQRLILTATSYGGRGLYWYAAGRPRVFAALVPMATSLAPNRAISEGVCCRTGEPSCCPPVWHVVGANDPGTLPYHEKWDGVPPPARAQPAAEGQHRVQVHAVRVGAAAAPKEYAHMTGHAPYDLAWDPNEDAPAHRLAVGAPLRGRAAARPADGPHLMAARRRRRRRRRRRPRRRWRGGGGGGGGAAGGDGHPPPPPTKPAAASRRSSSRRRARATRPRLAT